MIQARFNSIVGKEGKFFKVVFTKKNKERRVMSCRLGVKKHLVGSSGKGKAPVEGLVNVWEPQAGVGKQAYRSFRLDSVIELHAHGKSYNGEGEEIKVA